MANKIIPSNRVFVFFQRIRKFFKSTFFYSPITAMSADELPLEAVEEEETTLSHPIEEIKMRVEQWVEERHYTNPELTVEQTLKQINISAYELNYYLDSELHINGFRRWIPYLRVEEAKRLLLEKPNYSLDAIAAECGYSSRSTLSRTFKTQEGIAPTEWVVRQKETIKRNQKK